MASLRSRKNLSCFYCGRRSGLKFEGQHSFGCTHCDATNWLDEHGDITDPPAPNSDEPRTPVRYAAPRTSTVPRQASSLSPVGPALGESIFCSRCLRNQRMYTESLRQYEFPDDINDPEYAERERTYRRWRRDLEQRYPQVCAECEPKVEAKLERASYTAKSDHVRRMLDRTRAQRQEVKKRGFLDVIDLAGKWSWNLAFALQLMWHILIFGALFVQWAGQNQSDIWAIRAFSAICQIVLGTMPSPDRLIGWAINTSLCSSPWNPRFKQTIRGFTSHILGFRQWYTYQLVIILIRYVCLLISQYNDSRGMTPLAQLGAHMVIMILMFDIHRNAGKTLRTDTTPLFGPTNTATLSPGQTEQTENNGSEREPDNLGDILDDILRSSTGGQAASVDRSPSFPNYHQSLGAQSPLRNEQQIHPTQVHQPDVGFGSLRLSDSPIPSHSQPRRPQVVQYDDQMDWVPSTSQHRAFANHDPYKVKNPNPRFSDAPIEAKPGPFWYKVPPAPTNPAQRLRNPPMRPIIRESPKEKKDAFFQSSTRGPVDIVRPGAQNSGSDITFKDPKFYAPEPSNDPRDKLSRMMGSFSISPSPDRQGARSRAMPGSFGLGVAASGVQNHPKVRMAELIALFGALYAWTTSLGSRETYAPMLASMSILACFIVSTRLTFDLFADGRAQAGKQPSPLRPSWLNLGIAQSIAALVLVLKLWPGNETRFECGLHGNVLFGIMIAHQVWHVFG